MQWSNAAWLPGPNFGPPLLVTLCGLRLCGWATTGQCAATNACRVWTLAGWPDASTMRDDMTMAFGRLGLPATNVSPRGGLISNPKALPDESELVMCEAGRRCGRT